MGRVGRYIRLKNLLKSLSWETIFGLFASLNEILVNFEQWTFFKSIVSDRDWNINDKEQKPSTKKIFRKKDVGEDKEKNITPLKISLEE